MPRTARSHTPHTDTLAPALRERRVTLGHVGLHILCPVDPEAIIDDWLVATDGDASPRHDSVEPTVPYWVNVWPASVALGRRLVKLRLGGCRVLELGAGVGIAGIAAAHAGARVLLTDNQPSALAVAAQNAARNHLAVRTRLLDWCTPGWAEPFDLVIAADVLYERRLVEPLAALLPALVGRNGRAVIADPGRPCLSAFRDALEPNGLHVRFEPTHLFWAGEPRTVTLVHVAADAAIVRRSLGSHRWGNHDRNQDAVVGGHREQTGGADTHL